MYYVASCSFGKDSLAMILRLMEENKPLDEVVFYNTGMEFEAIYKLRDKILPLLYEKGIKFTELKPDRPFMYDMFDKPIVSRQGVRYNGNGWCGGMCRWGTHEKIKVLDKYKSQFEDLVEYVGIAFDEKERAKDKVYPLIEWEMTEKDCLSFCYKKGFNWLENGVDLYTILDRVSCWCCSNKNKKEFHNIWLYLPQYWERLKEIQSKIDRPMKKFQNKRFGFYGNVFDMEKVFEQLQNTGSFTQPRKSGRSLHRIGSSDNVSSQIKIDNESEFLK